MANPINYGALFNNQTPIQALNEGVNAGLNLFNIDLAKKQQQQQQQQLQRQLQRTAQFRADVTAFSENENPRGEDIAQLMIKHPEHFKELKSAWEVMAPDK